MRRMPCVKNALARTVSLLVAATLLLGLCGGCDGQDPRRLPSTPSPEEASPAAGDSSAAPAEESSAPGGETSPPPLDLTDYQRDSSPVPFSELVYTRPDLDALRHQMREEISGLRQSQTLAGALAHMEKAQDSLSSYDTMYVLSSLNLDTDLTDEYWQEEWAFCSEGYSLCDDLWGDMYTAIERSPYSAQLLPLWDPLWDIPYPYSSNPRKSNALERRMAELEAEAIDILDRATVRYRGQNLTLDDAYDRHDWVDACVAWYETHGEDLLDLYARYVAEAGTLAREYYGCDDYATYQFDRYYRDYTPDMARRLAQEIVTCMLPLDNALVEHGYWDDVYEPYGDFDDCVERAYQVLEIMGAEMIDALDLMLDYGLYYIEPGDHQYSRPYVHYLATPNVPFLFCPYYDDLMGVADFTHEFGHYYEKYVNRELCCFPDDLAEVHSQAMSLLFSQTHQVLTGDSTLLDFALAEAVDTLISQSFNASIELRVYALTQREISPEAIGEIGYQESVRYGYGSDHEVLSRYEWLSDSELFTDPLQPFCYTASAGVALELWRLSLEDMGEALARYDALIRHEESPLLVANIEAATIPSPFEEGWAEETADFLRRYLLDGEGAQAA